MKQTFLFSEIDFGDAWIQLDCFYVDVNKTIVEQIDFFTEDMLAIMFGEGQYCIDIGWQPSFDLEGSFVLRLIQSLDWDAPVIEECANSFLELDKLLISAVSIIKERTENFSNYPAFHSDFKLDRNNVFISVNSSRTIIK
jgi:hypothetical protein